MRLAQSRTGWSLPGNALLATRRRSWFENHGTIKDVLGRQLTTNPFPVFLIVLLWLWIWAPAGGFIAVPFLIIVATVAGKVLAATLADDTSEV